ncbi:MAG: N-6 DNA methylase, partial [Candidatus Njordarchaeales archaeon]
QHPEVRKLNRLGEKHIDKIADTYKKFKEEEGFSRIVSLDEMRENDYNLNVSIYVFPEEEVEDIDIEQEWSELLKINDELKKIEDKIAGYLKELAYEEKN